MGRTRFGTWKTRMCQIFCIHFQSVPHNQNIKKCMFGNEFHLLLNTTNILMHVSLGIISKRLSAVFDGHRKFGDTHKMKHAAYGSNHRLATQKLERASL